MLFEKSMTLTTLVLFATAMPASASQPDSVEPTATEAHLMSLPTLTALDGTPLAADTLDNKVVLFVNVASKCGFTPQYDGLQALYAAKKDQGLVIVGVPCNQFGAQEPGSPTEIASFCRMNYGVDFPLLEKQDVNGGDRSELYQWLVGSEAGGGKDVRWNFEKFLVGKSGQVIDRYTSQVKPSDDGLVAAIDAALAR